MCEPAGQFAALLSGDAAGRASGGGETHTYNEDEHQQAGGSQHTTAAGVADEGDGVGVAVHEVSERFRLGEAVERGGAEQHRHHRDGARAHRHGG